MGVTIGDRQVMQTQIEEYLRFLAVEKGYSKHTIVAYRNDLIQFLTYLAGEIISSWEAVERAHILNYILHLKEREYASSTVAPVYVTVVPKRWAVSCRSACVLLTVVTRVAITSTFPP